jgi:hypothetical protein
VAANPITARIPPLPRQISTTSPIPIGINHSGASLLGYIKNGVGLKETTRNSVASHAAQRSRSTVHDR